MIDVVLFAVAIIVCAVIVACSIADARDDRKREMSEYNAMDHRHKLRQAKCATLTKENARDELFYTYVNMQFPEGCRHD
jgi:hypothetical protein